MRFNNIKKRLIRKLKFINLKKKSFKLSSLYKKLLNSKLNIYDIGAGQRILPEVINFDGNSRVYLIDPNKNLDYSFNQLKNYFFDYKNIFKFRTAISDKTKIQNYYESKISTISTFALNKKKTKKYSKFYSSKPSKQMVYTFKDFLKINKLPKPDMIKIDVEGLELKVLNSILNCSDPFLIQVEVNINNPIFMESFSSINSVLNKKNYFLYTLFPSYGEYDFSSNKKINNNINLNDIETNFNKKFLLQSECYYVKKIKKYNAKQFVLISGFGLSSLFLEKFEKNKKKINIQQRKLLSKVYNIIK